MGLSLVRQTLSFLGETYETLDAHETSCCNANFGCVRKREEKTERGMLCPPSRPVRFLSLARSLSLSLPHCGIPSTLPPYARTHSHDHCFLFFLVAVHLFVSSNFPPCAKKRHASSSSVEPIDCYIVHPSNQFLVFTF